MQGQQESLVRKGHIPFAADDQVVKDWDVEQFSSLDRLGRNFPIGLACCQVARRMVVRQDDARSVCFECRGKYQPYVYYGTACATC